MDDALRERVEALERAVTDGEHDLSAFADDAAALERLETLEADVADLADRVEELEAATQALRGYVGNVRSVNTEVEQRADAALAKAEALEDRLGETTAAANRQPSAPNNGRGSATGGDTADGGDGVGDDDPAGTDEAAVDEWEWVTDDDTGGPRRAHADGTADAGASGTAGTDVEGAGASDGGGAATASRHAGGGAPSGNDTGQPRHGAGADSGLEATPAGGERAGRTRRETGGRCASCGRPHSSDGGSASREIPGREPPGATGEGRVGQEALTTDRGQAAGAPTVAEIAERDPARIGSDDDAPGDDGDVLPDGAEDPLIGSGGDDRPGTLQRIRDLL